MFVEWAGVVRGRVHIGLLQWVEAGFVIGDQVILVQSLGEGRNQRRRGERRDAESAGQGKEIRSQAMKEYSNY